MHVTENSVSDALKLVDRLHEHLADDPPSIWPVSYLYALGTMAARFIATFPEEEREQAFMVVMCVIRRDGFTDPH